MSGNRASEGDTTMDPVQLEFFVDLPAATADAFATLTEPAHLVQWFCDEADGVPGLGGEVRWTWRRAGSSPETFVGRWIEWDPPRVAAYEGGHAGYPGGNAGRVRIEIIATPAGPRLRVEHSLPGTRDHAPVVERYREVWPRALARLARHLEL